MWWQVDLSAVKTDFNNLCQRVASATKEVQMCLSEQAPSYVPLVSRSLLMVGLTRCAQAARLSEADTETEDDGDDCFGIDMEEACIEGAPTELQAWLPLVTRLVGLMTTLVAGPDGSDDRDTRPSGCSCTILR